MFPIWLLEFHFVVSNDRLKHFAEKCHMQEYCTVIWGTIEKCSKKHKQKFRANIKCCVCNPCQLSVTFLFSDCESLPQFITIRYFNKKNRHISLWQWRISSLTDWVCYNLLVYLTLTWSYQARCQLFVSPTCWIMFNLRPCRGRLWMSSLYLRLTAVNKVWFGPRQSRLGVPWHINL